MIYAYANYKHYVEEYGGTKIPETDFAKCIRQACSYIDYCTMNRITAPDGVVNLKDCACEMAEAVYDMAYKDDGMVKKSENIDGYSVSYATEAADGVDKAGLLNGKLYQICRRYLVHTGLMSRRVRGC